MDTEWDPMGQDRQWGRWDGRINSWLKNCFRKEKPGCLTKSLEHVRTNLSYSVLWCFLRSIYKSPGQLISLLWIQNLKDLPEKLNLNLKLQWNWVWPKLWISALQCCKAYIPILELILCEWYSLALNCLIPGGVLESWPNLTQ